MIDGQDFRLAAEQLAAELARSGVIVVSGLAIGIDSAAHRGCINGGGVTVAVMGTGVDVISPAANVNLAEEIIASGGAQEVILSSPVPLHGTVEEVDGHPVLTKHFKFKGFLPAVDFVNRIAPIAEAEGHHPDLLLGWGYATVRLWTHAAGGLTENDFILAAKVDQAQSSKS